MRERPIEAVHQRPQLRESRLSADPTPSFGDAVGACVTARRRTVPHGTRPAQCPAGGRVEYCQSPSAQGCE